MSSYSQKRGCQHAVYFAEKIDTWTERECRRMVLLFIQGKARVSSFMSGDGIENVHDKASMKEWVKKKKAQIDARLKNAMK